MISAIMERMPWRSSMKSAHGVVVSRALLQKILYFTIHISVRENARLSYTAPLTIEEKGQFYI
jgi:hypothetical protein